MAAFFDSMAPEQALEIERLSRLAYDLRESCNRTGPRTLPACWHAFKTASLPSIPPMTITCPYAYWNSSGISPVP